MDRKADFIRGINSYLSQKLSPHGERFVKELLEKYESSIPPKIVTKNIYVRDTVSSDPLENSKLVNHKLVIGLSHIDIHHLICEITGINPNAVTKGGKQPRSISLIKFMCEYFVYKKTNMSFPEVGRYFNLHHASVIHANNVVTKKMKKDQAFKELMDRIEFAIDNLKIKKQDVRKHAGIEHHQAD